MCSLSHYPLVSWNHKPYGCFNLHGHCHGNIDEYNENSADLRVDVGIDGRLSQTLETPLIDFRDILKYFQDKVGENKEFNVYALRISPSGRVSRKVIPQKSKFIKENNNSYYTGTFYNEKGKPLGSTWYYGFRIFDNYEEAVKDWNIQVQNTLDKSISEFETKIKNISSLKI